MSLPPIPKTLIIIGLIFVLAGLFFWILGNKLNWFGRLPGDIIVDKENFKFYFPITSMILLSILVSLIIYLFKKFIN